MQNRRSGWLGLSAAVASVTFLGLGGPAPAAPDLKPPLRFTSFLVNTWSGRSGVLDVSIKNWSSPQQSQAIEEAVDNGGMSAAVQVLQKMPNLGEIDVPGFLGLELHFTRAMPGPNGTTQVLALTDRWLRTWEVANDTITTDYPLTVVELTLKPNGQGTGSVLPMARITYWDPKTNIVAIDNFSMEPLELPSVKLQKGH